MKPVLPLFIMLDACGWEIVKNDPFLKSLAPNRRKLNSVFGYSSACVPSIVSGHWPEEHRNWSYFVYDPKNSPFKFLRPLRWLPKALTSRRIFRRWLTKFVRSKIGFKGYFDLYNIPFEHIAQYDFSEKKSPLKPGGMNRGDNIFDFLESKNINYFSSNPDLQEDKNFPQLISAIEKGSIDFAFSYWPGLDGLLHNVGNQSPEVPAKLRDYEKWIAQVMQAAKGHYEDVRLYVFSDHGMANCDELLDLKSVIEALPLKMGTDYAVVYDSTMARFWFFNALARTLVHEALNKVPEGRIISDAELKELRAFFPDRYFGETIFLVREGVLIVPSHMGERPIRAMHGYHPSEKHSFATLFTNRPELPDEIVAIPDIHTLMVSEAQNAKTANSRSVVLVA
ncbi:MAG: Type phosphodiesterase/nucleotide pyrophosphatase [Verrucomicrobiales bacterium]|nr:Type phosphodiesterase/nucleotide pyrophosphatase [Verrucomicrobiales bacterium]